jgi:hypothetical protein
MVGSVVGGEDELSERWQEVVMLRQPRLDLLGVPQHNKGVAISPPGSIDTRVLFPGKVEGVDPRLCR